MKENLENSFSKILTEILLHPPIDYQNLVLISELKNATWGVLRIQPIEHQKTHKVLKIRALILDFDQTLEVTIFHPKPFHLILFSIGKIVYVYGMLQKRFGYEMIQPKIVKEFGEIIPVFSRNKAKNSQMRKLIKEYLTQENLEKMLLPKAVIEEVMQVFYPSFEFFVQFEKYKGLPPKTLEIFKMLEICFHLHKMRKKKKLFPSKFQCHGDYAHFISSLPFVLTQGQNQAIAEISKDLKSPIACKRIVMGDVGCGKTIVILASVMMVYPYKSILMAPTTILAQQLYQEALKFLPPSLSVGLFTSESKEQNFLGFDFVIGTQALLYKNENLSDFALVMTDEQHRFGTMQRHTLEKFASKGGKKPHILQFSATPIPRTMAMLQSELIAHTFILDTPFKKDISTQVFRKKDFPALLDHIRSEIAQDHQVAIVYPLVEESENFSYMPLKKAQEYWCKHFERVYSTSGGDKNKDEVIEEFRDKGAILLSTTVIEVGISLPRLSTIVIVGAERMGFATLHQLRGRVSRNGLKGYCFLFTHQEHSRRLDEFVRTKNGFEIAELDLRYRKSGDLLEGKNQSGDEFVFFDPAQDLQILQKAKELQIKI
ncbi:ATP-dependent DNA helicase RecG [Helicobacter kayseriensis]|uniref:ATP-dependent DNA helicase RecG n=1 Tax=Helicobacter kayseriensis TaxID=2905877 RepID=UPI001E5F727D|nr:ATP-dependent DNA helicase RecG [Helicobacter kayseriensis]MCE3047395.1 ATP-dependent DNA helicase RecG [Helicobacter kayseriensis]MCE3048934.1 ATP-dependent DNA helicase RecG [Helicobacter kayseriensis]